MIYSFVNSLFLKSHIGAILGTFDVHSRVFMSMVSFMPIVCVNGGADHILPRVYYSLFSFSFKEPCKSVYIGLSYVKVPHVQD